MRTVGLCLVALVLLLGLGVGAEAAEKRCNDLGANCVCSEPLNTTTFARNAPYYNPADSTTKECSAEGVPGGAIARNTSDIYGDNNAAAMAALPAGKTISHFVRAGNGHLGIYFIGHGHNSATFTKRLAARFYIYHTPDFQFAQEGVCTNAKLMQFTGPNSLLDHSFGPLHMYNFLDFTPAQDCCFTGPGPDQGKIDKPYWRGKWVRVEAVYTNRAGPGWRMQVYLKNVTDNGPELLVVDTAATGTQLNNPVSRTPPRRQDLMLINAYRETGCVGWEGFSHYMMAGWDTDSGQRIGPAAEIEAGGTVTPPPTAYQLTATPVGAGTVTGAGNYPVNTVVTPVATPSAGATFGGWSGDCTGTGACSVTMTADKAVTATFTGGTPPPSTCTITPTPAAITFTHPPGGPLPAPQSVRVVTSDNSAYRTFDTGFYDAAPCYSQSCPSGTLTTITPMPTTLSLAAGTYTYPLDLTAGPACPKVTVPVVLTIGAATVPPPSMGKLTVDAQITRCNYFLTAEPPDTTGGWVAQFLRDGANTVGNPISTPPYRRSVELFAPSHSFTVEFSKTGTIKRSPAAVTRVCP